MVSKYQGNKCGTPCSVILGNLLKGAHRSPLRDYCNHIELSVMLIEFIKRLAELFDMLGEFITALFINGLIELIDRLVIGLNELILTLTFL